MIKQAIAAVLLSTILLSGCGDREWATWWMDKDSEEDPIVFIPEPEPEPAPEPEPEPEPEPVGDTDEIDPCTLSSFRDSVDCKDPLPECEPEEVVEEVVEVVPYVPEVITPTVEPSTLPVPSFTPRPSWADSYSVGGKCYMATTFDHGVGEMVVETPVGPRTVRQVAAAIGAGPGAAGNPVYNDVQCGNGPPNSFWDEIQCPGRVDQGSAGCIVIGPKWDLSNIK